MYLILYIKRTLRQSVEHFRKICGKKNGKTTQKEDICIILIKQLTSQSQHPNYIDIMKYYFSGYIKLNRYLNKIGFTTSNLCDTCQQEETVEHFLLHCKQYNAYRRNMIDHLLQLGVTDFKLTKLLSGNNFQPVVDYINATNRF